MKRIHQYKKLFEIEKDIDLKDLKKKYRDLVKKWHPDKFQDTDPLQKEAEIQSRRIIDGYHFLVSMAPQTKEKNLPSYRKTITSEAISNYQHKGLLLEITFTDGTTYEYFGITKPVYQKMVNAGNLNRFAKRNIYPKYTYRKSKRILQES